MYQVILHENQLYSKVKGQVLWAEIVIIKP